MRVHVVPHLAQPLPFGEQDHEAFDGGGEGREIGAWTLRQNRHQIGAASQELELRGNRRFQTIQEAAGPRGGRQRGQSRLELGGGLTEHRVKEAALGVVVVEQQLLVDSGAAGDPVDPRAVESALSEF